MSESQSRQLDRRVMENRLQSPDDVEQAAQIAVDAMAQPPDDLWVAGRCLQLVDAVSNELAASLQPRIEQYRRHVDALAARSMQVDQIGDIDTPPAAIFDVLGTAADHLPLMEFDPRDLHSARVGVASRAEAARNVFAKLGLTDLKGEVAQVMLACSSMMRRASAYQAQALFVDATDVGWVLGVQLVLNQDGKVTAFPSVDETMAHQARAALEPHLEGRGAHWDIEWPVSFGGASIGLSLYVSLLVATSQLKPDPLMAVTGSVDIGGVVHGVEGIGAKLRAAANSGMRRVVLPEDNRPEAEASAVRNQLDLIFVTRTAEVRSRLLQATARASVGFDGLVRYVRHLLPQAALEVGAEESKPGFHRFKAGDSGGGVNVDVYPNGTVRASGPAGPALEAARKLIAEQLESLKPQARQPLVRNVPTLDRRARLLAILEEAAATELPANQYEAWRRRLTRGGSQTTIVLYESGKCVVQGQAPAFDEAVAALNVALEGLTPQQPPEQASQAPSSTPAVDSKAPHIGTDEAGKGDFFGPLVSAAVYVDSRLASQLIATGVKDSKLLSDASVKRIAAEIRDLLGNRARVTLVPPKRFNELYAQMRSEGKNLNTLLAWSHTRSIEDLIRAGLKPEYVVIDQFGDRKYIEGKLLADTRQSGIPIVQMPKAEADVAVAAASILARDGFLDWLQQAAQRLGRTLPKGASDRVIATAREIVATQGRDALMDIAKVSFKTMEKVLAP